jgi:putative heme-binding domain-containing protein
LVGATIDALLEQLKAPEDWTRQQAKRVLKERGPAEVVPRLASWVKGLDPKDPEHEHHRLEALWTYQAVNVAEPQLLKGLLHSDDARVRAAATRVVPFWKTRVADPRSLLAERVLDAEPRVRLEAVRGLALIPDISSAGLALAALDHPVDVFLEYGLWLTARQLAPFWMPEVQAGRFDFGGRPERLIFAVRAVDSPAIVKPLLALLKEGKVPGGQDEHVQTLIARLGDPGDLAVMLDLLIAGEALPSPRRVSLLNTLVGATRDRKVAPAGDLARIGPLVTGGDDALREAAVRAIGTWNVGSLQNKLMALVGAADTSRGVRAAAIEALVKNGGAEGRRAVAALAERGAAPEVQARALAALLEADPQGTAPRFIAWLGQLSPDQSSAAGIVLARVLELRGAPAVMASALDHLAPTLSADLAKLCIRQVRASGRDEPGLIGALERAGRLKEGVRKLSDKEMNQLLTDVSRTGDPARGEAIFRRKDMNCQKCHAIAGAGGQVGPGLESIGASAQPDYLVDSLLEPGKAVKENYHALVVATSDGKLYTGIKLRQTDSELVLRDAEDREVAIPVNSIEEQKTAGSLMPAGLTEALTRPELIDLVRFLSQLGKIGPYSVGTDRVLRCWQVLQATPAVKSTVAKNGFEALLSGEQSLNWRPAYTTAAGKLPLSEWAEPERTAATAPVALLRSQLEVTSPGTVKLTFNSADALSIWIDGRRVQPVSGSPRQLVLDLMRGLHTIAVAVDLARRQDGIRCVLEDIRGSSARARVVLGK